MVRLFSSGWDAMQSLSWSSTYLICLITRHSVAERYSHQQHSNDRTILANLIDSQTTLPQLDNPFSQRVNAVIQKTREMRRGVYHPHLYIVKEDGEPPLRLWALSGLIQDRADVLPSYQQFIGQLKDKVRTSSGGSRHSMFD